MALTYDMVFLSALLASLYGEPEETGRKYCAARPLARVKYAVSGAAAYAADISILLAYHKAEDDWRDDHSLIARQAIKTLQKSYEEAAARWPRQAAAVVNRLRDLSAMEAENELNPDRPANCFGLLTGELFVYHEADAYSKTLRNIGESLGRFIYLLDAHDDLRSDLRRKKYNPLTAVTGVDFPSLFKSIMNECASEFEKLPLTRDLPVLRNILYSGVWTRCKRIKAAE
jgi:hypothetical protein